MKRHPAEVRAHCTVQLMAGRSASVLSRETGLPKGTLSRWRAGARELLGMERQLYAIICACLRPLPVTKAQQWAVKQAKREAERLRIKRGEPEPQPPRYLTLAQVAAVLARAAADGSSGGPSRACRHTGARGAAIS